MKLKMFRIRKNKTFFKDRVKKLMRNRKNDKLKYIIENQEMYPFFRDSTGTTLLHMAAKYGNAEMIKYFINLGCEVDAKDSSGTTPLMIATKYNHCYATKLLLEANADIFITNLAKEYPLQLMFERNKTVFYTSIIKIYYNKVKNSSSNDEEVAEILLKAGCSLDQAAVMQDSKVTKIFLEKIETFDEIISCRSVLISMFLIDFENLKVLLHHGSQVTDRIEDFLWYLHDICNTGVIQAKQINFFGKTRVPEALRVFTKNTIEWNLLDQQNLKFMKYMFEDADKEILKIVLESGIHDHVQNRLSYNLLAHVYGNGNPGVIQLLRDMNIDLSGCFRTGAQGVTALHLAVFRCLPDNVKLLLDMGADPNIADEHGETPLFCILSSREPLKRKIECVDLLLKSNVDIEICDNVGSSFIEYVDLDDDDHLPLLEYILAYLAMFEMRNLPVKQSVLEYVNSQDKLRCRYETCQRQLEEMKRRKVATSFSLIRVLTSEPDKIARFVGAQIGNIIQTLGDSLQTLNVYYAKQFKERLNRALKVYKLRSKVHHLIGENIPKLNGYNPVVDNIVSHFNFEELMTFN